MDHVKHIMTVEPRVISPDSTIQEAAQLMKEIDVGALPVCNGDRLVGMITDRDIVIRAVCDAKFPPECLVDEIMTRGIVYVYEEQDISEAARIMEAKKIRRLVVLNNDKRLVGIVTLGDLAMKPNAEELVGEFARNTADGRRKAA